MEIISVNKKGDVYVVQAGRRNGRGEREVVSVDIPAQHIDSRHSRDARNLMGRSASNVANAGYAEKR